MKVETESKGLGSSKEDRFTEVLIPVLSGRRTRPRTIVSRRVRHSVGSTGRRSRVTQFVSRHLVASFRHPFIFAAGRFRYRIEAKAHDRPAPIGALQVGNAATSRRFRSGSARVRGVESRCQTCHWTSRGTPRRLCGGALGAASEACATEARCTTTATRSSFARTRSEDLAPPRDCFG